MKLGTKYLKNDLSGRPGNYYTYHNEEIKLHHANDIGFLNFHILYFPSTHYIYEPRLLNMLE